MGADTDVGRFEVTSHFELAARGAFVIGRILDGFIRPGMCVDTHLEPPKLKITGVEVLNNISEKKHWNALIFAERPTFDFVKAAFPNWRRHRSSNGKQPDAQNDSGRMGPRRRRDRCMDP
jgi:hypothetical protein